MIVPSSARWFDLEAVSERERSAFPDWLEGREGRSAATTQWYRAIRNAVVTAYRANPRVYLTITACRRQVAADVGAVTRIHLFLQQSGLINYHVDPGSQPLMGSTSKEKISYPIFTHTTLPQQPQANTPAAATTTAAGSGSGDSAPALSQLFAFASASASALTSSTAGSAPSASSSSASALPPSFRRLLVGPVLGQDAAVNDPKRTQPVGAPLSCRSCARPLSDGLRFVGRVDPSVVLCPDCFGDGRLPLLMAADDFVRVEGANAASKAWAASAWRPPSSAFPALNGGSAAAAAPLGASSTAASPPSSGEWKAEETLRLLDALQAHGEDWEAVAEHVGGGKTKGSASLPRPLPSTPLAAPPVSPPLTSAACALSACALCLSAVRTRLPAHVAPVPACTALTSPVLTVCCVLSLVSSAPPVLLCCARSDECCLHFVSLPIENPFLDQYPNGVDGSQAAALSSSPSSPPASVVQLSESAAASNAPPSAASFPVPFADAGNPILAQIAFLASTVSPAVAAAAAQAALHFYSGEHAAASRAANGRRHTGPAPMDEEPPQAKEEQVRASPPPPSHPTAPHPMRLSPLCLALRARRCPHCGCV